MFRCLFIFISVVALVACTPLANPSPAPPTATLIPMQPTVTSVPIASRTPAPTVPPTITPTPVSFAEGVIVGIWDAAKETYSLAVVDPYTGLTLPNYPSLPLGSNYWASFTPDKGTLVIITYPSNENGLHGRLHLFDTETWQDTATSLEINNWVSARTFSADGQHFAVAYNRGRTNYVVLVDMVTQTPLTQTLPFLPTQMAFAPDGTTLMLYGTTANTIDTFNPATEVALLQVSDGSLLWEKPLPTVKDGSYVAEGATNPHLEATTWRPGVGFDPTQQRLYILLAENDRLLTVDFQAQTVTGSDLTQAQSWLEQFLATTAERAEAKELNGTFRYALLSPDYTQMFVTSVKSTYQNNQMLREPLGLMVIDLATGRIVAEAKGSDATEMSWSPDYRYLLVNDGMDGYQAEIWDAHTLTSVKTFPGQFLTAGYNRQGAPILLALSPMQTQGRYWALEPGTFSRLTEWPLRGFVEILDRP